MEDLPPTLDFDNAEPRAFLAGPAEAGLRLDLFLHPRLPEFSRAALQRMIRDGRVRLNGVPARPSHKVRAGDRVEVEVPLILPPRIEPEPIHLRLLHEEETFAVIDKPPGMAVHPGRGRPGGTLANAIAFRYGGISLGGEAHRPGIVHRLDLETSGAIVVARTERAHAALSDAFRERRVRKEYRALVHGEPPLDEDTIDLPIGRDPVHPDRMTVRFDVEREALTVVRVVERFPGAAHLLCLPKTGRTHQIRVHLASRGHPILGDETYSAGKSGSVPVPRVMLHAHRLAFPHPITGAPVSFEAPLPEDFLAVIGALRAGRG